MTKNYWLSHNLLVRWWSSMEPELVIWPLVTATVSSRPPSAPHDLNSSEEIKYFNMSAGPKPLLPTSPGMDSLGITFVFHYRALYPIKWSPNRLRDNYCPAWRGSAGWLVPRCLGVSPHAPVWASFHNFMQVWEFNPTLRVDEGSWEP